MKQVRDIETLDLEILESIQNWFSQNCDGDWEHAQNIIITTIDNPGWSVTINLVGTNLENCNFQTVKMNKNELDWYYCTIKNMQFQGDGGVTNLTDILKIFISFTQSNLAR